MKDTTTTTTTIALLPERAANKVQPKPSKKEVIEALVQIKRKEFEEFEAKQEIDEKAAEDALTDACLEWVRSNLDKLSAGAHTSTSLWNGETTLTLEIPRGNVKAKADKLDAVKSRSKPEYNRYGRFDEKECRKAMTANINSKSAGGVDRVKAMLEEPAILKGLKGLLAEFENSKSIAA